MSFHILAATAALLLTAAANLAHAADTPADPVVVRRDADVSYRQAVGVLHRPSLLDRSDAVQQADWAYIALEHATLAINQVPEPPAHQPYQQSLRRRFASPQVNGPQAPAPVPVPPIERDLRMAELRQVAARRW